jgi:hypothetical protein
VKDNVLYVNGVPQACLYSALLQLSFPGRNPGSISIIILQINGRTVKSACTYFLSMHTVCQNPKDHNLRNHHPLMGKFNAIMKQNKVTLIEHSASSKSSSHYTGCKYSAEKTQFKKISNKKAFSLWCSMMLCWRVIHELHT